MTQDLDLPPPQGLTTAQFAQIAEIAKREAGLTLSESKTAMIASRLAKRLRALDLESFDTYCAHLGAGEGAAEITHLISALTTNVTHFFRERHHFGLLREDILPELRQRAAVGDPVRIWSAGCSDGQEAYSIGITMLDAWPEAARSGLRILGTDIDTKMIRKAQAGRYPARQLEPVERDLRQRYFGPAESDGTHSVTSELRAMIRFNNLNLIGPWPMRTRFDVIFCRNVVIYFDAETQNRLWPRFAECLKPGGWLILGHSERVPDTADMPFRAAGRTAYRLRS